LRVFVGLAVGPAALEVPVPPDSRHSFLHVGRAGIHYVAELGYFLPGHHWQPIATSEPVTTPREAPAEAGEVQFASLAEANQVGPVEPVGLIAPVSLPSEWTPQQERALAELLATRFEAGVVSSPQGGALPEVSSPPGGEAPVPAGFWFSVNAELTIYGATEPGATLTIGGRQIPLRPDGTFSCRFALPDGQYELDVAATSTAGELRQAELKFARGSTYDGEVGVEPRDPSLKPPAAENQT
jgi:hypothetical protein